MSRGRFMMTAMCSGSYSIRLISSSSSAEARVCSSMPHSSMRYAFSSSVGAL